MEVYVADGNMLDWGFVAGSKIVRALYRELGLSGSRRRSNSKLTFAEGRDTHELGGWPAGFRDGRVFGR